MIATRRLPGIRFDTSSAEPRELLPRMDIAVFVGFAATGPLHIPVAIESAAQFAAVFGPDAPLAWDSQRGERIYAYLAPTVRSFFANGGVRCWVIRVARSERLETLRCGWLGAEPVPFSDLGCAAYNRFPLSGVLAAKRDQAGKGWRLRPAYARARCEGSWSDGLRVATAAAKQSIEINSFSKLSDLSDDGYVFFTPSKLSPDDMVRLNNDSGHSLFGAVQAVSAQQAGSSQFHRVTLQAVACLREVSGNLPALRNSQARLYAVNRTESSDSAELQAEKLAAKCHFDAGEAIVTLSAMPQTLPATGSWLEVGSNDGESYWIRTANVELAAESSASPHAGVVLRGKAWQVLPVADLDTPPFYFRGAAVAEVLTIDLRVELDANTAVSMSELGLAPGHARYWNRQPSDEMFFASGSSQDSPALLPAPVLPNRELSQRFPLAGSGDDTQLLLPLALDAIFSDSLGSLGNDATALERDGLSRLEADLFLDPSLGSVEANLLSNHADFLRYVSPAPRRLLGIHAALGFGDAAIADEATLIAVPDAVHLGWQPADTGQNPLDQPVPPESFLHPQWLGHDRGCVLTKDEKNRLAKMHKPETGQFLDCGTNYIRPPKFIEHSAPFKFNWIRVAPAATFIEEEARGVYRLKWTKVWPAAVYIVEQARLNDFRNAREIYQGPLRHTKVVQQGCGQYFYRVRAVVGSATSNWSQGITVRVLNDQYRLNTVQEYASTDGDRVLLDLHRALLHMCAAKGELFAALSLPLHYQEADAYAHPARLKAGATGLSPASAGVPPIAAGSLNILSYGALYHPWLINKRSNGEYQTFPPDGAALGVMAARAWKRGAWIAPANQAYSEVVALSSAMRPEWWQALQDAQINMVRNDARGFLVISADTLAGGAELRPINVRRLLILLRRLALRRGANYVFEPHGDALRRMVQRAFETLLSGLFARGAFAGKTPAQSFQVITDSSINTPQNVEQGRFLVDLKVAPSLPMSFLTVRLQQVGERLSVTEGG